MATELKIAAEAQYDDNGAFKRADRDVDNLASSIDAYGLEAELANQKTQQLKNKTSQLAREVDEGTKSFRQAESELEDYRKELENSSRESKNLETSAGSVKSNFKSLAVGVGAATVAFAAVAEGAKIAYQAIKEGAAIKTAQNQFKILTEEVNISADALLNKMKTATRGYVKDADLIASANEIISLGLAETEDDIVNLATVIGGLGLDMQQVILTFANNSKARLDSLGLSVEDVDNKVKELEDAGFKGDAFDAAVLELLVARYEKLGGAIDEVEDATLRGEAAWANFIDGIKTGTAEAVGTAIIELDKLNKKTLELNFEAAGDLAVGDIDDIPAPVNFEHYVELLREHNIHFPDKRTARVWYDQAVAQNAAANEAERYVAFLERQSIANKVLNAEPLNVFDNLSTTTEQLDYLYRVSQDAAQATDDIVISIDDVVSAEEKRQEALEESAAQQEKLAAALKETQAQQGDYFITAAEGQSELLTSQEAVNARLIEQADAAGAGAEALAILKVATGELSEEQAIAALKSVALEEKLANLGAAIADGLDPQQALANLKTFQEELDKTEFTVPIRTAYDFGPNIGEAGGFSEDEIDVEAQVTSNTDQAYETFRAWELSVIEESVKAPLDIDTTLADATYLTLREKLEQPINVPVNIQVSGGGGVFDEIKALGGS